jgi:hypothetical protein
LFEARSPFALLDEVEHAREVLVLTYTAGLEFFERFALAGARALGALVTVISDATMVRADPMVVRRAGTQYLDGRAVCPAGAFHPKLLVIVGDGEARIAVGSGNLTMAGWHGNAETWTVLRADLDHGPGSMREAAAFLRELDASPIVLSSGCREALQRTATQLDSFPASSSGPRLVSSLNASIASQLPAIDQGVLELVLYAPFHDARVAGVRALLDHFNPASWTVFVRPDTEVDGPALEALTRERQGRIAWVAHEAHLDGKLIADERYWHGKLIQWTTADGVWALTGSPNLSASALLRSVVDGGNCELAVLSRLDGDITPPEGDAPPGGVAELQRPPGERDPRPSALLLSAIATGAITNLQLHRALPVGGVVQRYDVGEDQWRTTAPIGAGYDRYDLDISQAPVGQAIRILLDGDTASNSVFVADLARIARRQIKAVGKVRLSPEEVARLGLGNQLLKDLDELRAHLLSVGVTVAVQAPGTAPQGDEALNGPPAKTRPATGVSHEEYLAGCDPVLGQRMTEFALVLPALPGVSSGLDDAVGTLDTDEDTDVGDDDMPDRPPTLAEELRRRSPDERARYRSFVERLVARSSSYPMIVRALALRTVLHAIVARLWPDDRWPGLLADATRALGASGDEPREEERHAAASLAGVALALLRADVDKISRRDERTMRYRSTGHSVRGLLVDIDQRRVEVIASELLGRIVGAGGVLGVEHAVDETLHPPRGVDRALRILADEHGAAARLDEDGVIVMDDELARFPEPALILALALTEDCGPVYVRGTTEDGKHVIAGWCAPLLAVEKIGKAGAFGRAWNLSTGQTLATLDRADLPGADLSWSAKAPRPPEVDELLSLVQPLAS